MSPRRALALPDVPTVAESGVPGFAATNWQIIFLPARAPRAIVERLHADVQGAFANPAVQKHVVGAGFELMVTDPAQAADLLRTEVAKWARVIRESGTKPG